jgi:RNA polymerase sigma-B factor
MAPASRNADADEVQEDSIRVVEAPTSHVDSQGKPAGNASAETGVANADVKDAEAKEADAEGDDAEAEEIELDESEVVATPSGSKWSARDRDVERALLFRMSELHPHEPERKTIRDTLVTMHLPLVEHLARRFRDRGEPHDDLVQVGTIGLIKAVDRFDVERGVEFSTYATPTIVGEIKRHFRDRGWAIRVPRRLQELRLLLSQATSELSQRTGRSPTVRELAEHLGLTHEEILEGLESAQAYSTLSLDAHSSDEDSDTPSLQDSLGMEDEALAGVEYRESLRPLLDALPPRERQIVILRFFHTMTQSQIAAEIGISQMHVSRLLARSLTQLRAGLMSQD